MKWLALALALGACSSEKPPDHQAQPRPVALAPRPIATIVPEPEPSEPTPVDKGVEVEYRYTVRDCDEIADRVAELTAEDMRTKLAGQLKTDKQRAAAEKDVEEASQKERDAWLKQCEGLIGQVGERSRIDCALAAKAMKDIDECLNATKP